MYQHGDLLRATDSHSQGSSGSGRRSQATSQGLAGAHSDSEAQRLLLDGPLTPPWHSQSCAIHPLGHGQDP